MLARKHVRPKCGKARTRKKLIRQEIICEVPSDKCIVAGCGAVRRQSEQVRIDPDLALMIARSKRVQRSHHKERRPRIAKPPVQSSSPGWTEGERDSRADSGRDSSPGPVAPA